MNSTATNAGGWKSSEMNSFLNSTFYNGLPNDLKSVIVACTKYTDNVGGTGDSSTTNLATNVTATSQAIWLMTQMEIEGKVGSRMNPGEKDKQAQYDYYASGNTLGKGTYWTRSPLAYNSSATDSFFVATTTDTNGAKATVEYQIFPCFCIG